MRPGRSQPPAARCLLRHAYPTSPNVAITGAWSLVPMSTSTGQLVALDASDGVAST